ncbi:MAG: DUF2905 domain-containing protein [Candidatus Latescibacteria bacterium]|nr:DUF2905 domain-containing protein [Candidatus Latescibacterota bacterium]
MDGRFHTGYILILAGIVLVVAGLAMIYIGKIPFPGRLPGDINIYGKNWSFHFPIVTGLIISLILTIIFTILFRR